MCGRLSEAAREPRGGVASPILRTKNETAAGKYSPFQPQPNLCLILVGPSQDWPYPLTWPRTLRHLVVLPFSHYSTPLIPNPIAVLSQTTSAATLVGEGDALGSEGSRATFPNSSEHEENVRCPHRSRHPADEVNLKLILLSTHDEDFEIFLNPRTGAFYTVTVETEDEGDEQDETVLTDARQLAHSVRVKSLL